MTEYLMKTPSFWRYSLFVWYVRTWTKEFLEHEASISTPWTQGFKISTVGIVHLSKGENLLYRWAFFSFIFIYDIKYSMNNWTWHDETWLKLQITANIQNTHVTRAIANVIVHTWSRRGDPVTQTHERLEAAGQGFGIVANIGWCRTRRGQDVGLRDSKTDYQS